MQTENEAISTVDVQAFEGLVCLADIGEAETRFYRILDFFSGAGGRAELAQVLGPAESGDVTCLLTRLCAAIGQMALRQDFAASIPALDTLMKWQEALSKLFFLTPFRNADHLLVQFLSRTQEGVLTGPTMLKLVLFTTAESALLPRLAPLMEQLQDIHVATCLMLVWACTGTKQSSENREWAYARLADHFAKGPGVAIPGSLIHGYFMHSSYGFADDKHGLKTAINRMIRTSLEAGHEPVRALRENPPWLAGPVSSGPAAGKPVLLVILEYFNPHHSVYRVLGKSLHACKEYFTLVAVAWPGFVSHMPDDFFDETVTLSGRGGDWCVDELVEIARKFRPAGVYYPAVGMSPWAIYFSNLRFAPVQFCGIGHGASSQAMEMDYFAIEEDIAGDPQTYSEKLLPMPVGSMPFYPPGWVEYHPLEIPVGASTNCVNIVCCSSTIKLNWRFLSVCRRVAQRFDGESGGKRVKFHFLLGASSAGTVGEACRRLIREYLPEAVVCFHQPFQSYLDQLAQMDISLSPFPFGGMNGVMDSARLGVVGVCMEGPHVHEAFDGGMWRRMGMPEWLIAHDEVAYEAAVVRLIENSAERRLLRDALLRGQGWKSFFDGDPGVFARKIKDLLCGGESTAVPVVQV